MGNREAADGDPIVSEILIRRRGRRQDVTIGTSTSTASTLRVDDVAAGIVFVAAITATATLTLYAAPSADAGFLPLMAADGSPSTIDIGPAPAAYSLPPETRGAHLLRLVSDADIGTATVSMTS